MNKKELFNEEREISGQQKVVCVGCEPERQVIKANSQNGVTMYIDTSLNAVVDMDVEDWVREIEFNAKEAKEYLKRNAKRFALKLIQNKDEERLAKLLKVNNPRPR